MFRYKTKNKCYICIEIKGQINRFRSFLTIDFLPPNSMARRWRLLLIALLLVLAIFRSVNAYDDDDDDGDDEDEEEYYHEQEMDYGLFHHQKEEVITNTFIHTITFQQPSQVIPATTVTVTVRDATTTVPVVGVGTSNPAPDVPQAYNETLDFEGLEEELGTCSDQGLTNEIFRWFTGIFFGDFYTFGGTDILGPLAVKGTFIAPDYVVNAEKDVDCSAANSVQSYGLVVGGTASTRNTQVHGSVFVAGGGDLSELKQLEGDCLVTGTQRTGLVDFVALEKEAVGISDIYRKHEPTLQLQSDGSLKRLDIVDNGVDYLTFNSCNDQPSCQNIWKDEMSVFDNIFGGVGNWNGIQGDIKPDPNITYVFNIPVMEDTTITLKTNEPIKGFNPCKVVLNFYPVNRNSGAYSPTGAFTILRNTSGQLGGLTLAPRGNIRDGTTGNFAGNIIALSYTWAFTNGVEIHNYKAVGGDCDSFDGCNPEPRKTTPDCANKGTTSTTTATATATVTQQLTVVNDVTQFTTQTDTKTETSSFTETKTDSFTETKTDRFTETKTDSYTETKTDRFTETKTDSYTETQTDNYTTTRTVQVLQIKYIDRTTTTTDSYTTTTTDSFTETETNNIAATATITSTITQDPDTTTATETETETGTTTATTTEYSIQTFTEVSVNTTVATTTQFNTDTETTTTTEFSTNTATSTTTEFQTDTATTTTTEVSLNTATTTEISLSTVTNINNVTTTETTTTTETETTRGLVIGGGGGDVTYTEIETDTEELYLTVTQTVALPTGNYVAETSTETVTVTDFPAPPAYTSLTEPLTYIYTQVLTYTHTHDQYCGHKYQEEDDEDGDDYDEENDDNEDDDEEEDDCDEEDDDDADHYKKNYQHKQR